MTTSKSIRLLLAILKTICKKEKRELITNNTLVVLKSLNEKEKLKLTSIDQISLSRSALIISKSLRENESLQNTRVSKRHRSTKASRRKFRHDLYKRVSILKEKINY